MKNVESYKYYGSFCHSLFVVFEQFFSNKHFPYYNFIILCHNIPVSEIFGNQNYIDYDGTQCDKGCNNQQRQA